MHDRPTLEELIEAARLHMESNIIPAIRRDAKLYFQTLVAINVLKIAEREVQRLPQPSDDNSALCADIRAGKYDDDPQALFEQLKATTMEKLEVANPRFLATLAKEDADPSLDAWVDR